MSERVDKGWADKGLENYPLEAIFNSLRHYGADVDEPQYRALAAKDYPLAIASQWHEGGWKGTGQFSRFPAAASEELWRRFMAPEPAPTDVALVVLKLVDALEDVLDGQADDGTWNTRFAVVESWLPKIPTDPERRDRFLSEFFAVFDDEWIEAFDALAFELAKEGHLEFAQRFVPIEEALVPARRGTVGAVVMAGKGDTEGALTTLRTVAKEPGRDDYGRLAVADAFLQLDAFDDGKALLLTLLAEAESARNLELASAVVEMLTELLRAQPNLPDKQAIRDRVESLAEVLGEAEE